MGTATDRRTDRRAERASERAAEKRRGKVSCSLAGGTGAAPLHEESWPGRRCCWRRGRGAAGGPPQPAPGCSRSPLGSRARSAAFRVPTRCTRAQETHGSPPAIPPLRPGPAPRSPPAPRPWRRRGAAGPGGAELRAQVRRCRPRPSGSIVFTAPREAR